GGEMSFSKYLIGLSAGDRGFVGLPLFVMRAFRHRCFFVRRDSGVSSFADLAGKRIGTNGWPDTGNTWSRAALRAAGAGIDSITWWVGPIDETVEQAFGHAPATSVPEGVNVVPRGRTLAGMLVDGDLDAMMVPWPPSVFYEPDSPIARLFPDYRAVEAAYFRSTGIYPGHHILGLRREVVDAHPWVARRLYDAFEESRLLSQAKRLMLTDVTPWSLADLEETVATFGRDWQPNGVEANRAMVEAFCEEQFAQRLVARKVDADTVFAEFERAMRDTSSDTGDVRDDKR
ncbi:MAG TPA: ABC transporter substrate-binding protein, partial [Thermomicrobiales bacterium]|nr:ABC transporter substrate-binding protein [Thermomicrobiales bacterium]